MNLTIRSAAARVNFIVGPMVMLIGVGGAITAVVLAVVLGKIWFLLLFIPAAMGLGGGALVLWLARRARLEITPEGFTWGGFGGSPRSLPWSQVARILPPPPGASGRTAAIAQLRDGSAVEVEALWESSTSPAALLGGSDHSRALNALISGHQQYLARAGAR